MRKSLIKSTFPNLTNDNFEIKSPATHQYNCISWAAGRIDRAWWPFGGYWPDDVSRQVTADAFIEAYASIGYEVTDNPHLESGYEKIAIYLLNGLPKHASRQLLNGCWTSKLGNMEDVDHDSLEAVTGQIYGDAQIFMRRETKGFGVTFRKLYNILKTCILRIFNKQHQSNHIYPHIITTKR